MTGIRTTTQVELSTNELSHFPGRVRTEVFNTTDCFTSGVHRIGLTIGSRPRRSHKYPKQGSAQQRISRYVATSLLVAPRDVRCWSVTVFMRAQSLRGLWSV